MRTSLQEHQHLHYVHRHDDKYQTNSKFTSYFYPGYLPGLMYGWNQYLTFSENAVFPVHINVGGLGDNLIGRDLLNAVSLQDAVSRAGVENRACGISINIGIINNGFIANIEFSADNISVYWIQGNYSHTNMYKHLNVDQYSDESSIHRDHRINELPTVQGAQDILTVLGDTQDPQYPIYRNSSPPDCCSTCSSILFDLDAQLASIFISNPKTTYPLLQFQLGN